MADMARINPEGIRRYLSSGPTIGGFEGPYAETLAQQSYADELAKGSELPNRGGIRVGQGSPVVSTAPAVPVGTPYPPNPNTLPALRTPGGAVEGIYEPPMKPGVPALRTPGGAVAAPFVGGVTRFGGGQLIDPGGGLVGHYSRNPNELKKDMNTVQSLLPAGNDPYETNISKLAASGRATNVVDKYVNAAGSAVAGGVGNLVGRFANDPNFFGTKEALAATPQSSPLGWQGGTKTEADFLRDNPQTDSTPIDWTKAGADAIKAVGGFGKEPRAAYDSTADDASRLAARDAQYASTARDAAGTDLLRKEYNAILAADKKDWEKKDLQSQITDATNSLAFYSTLGPGGDGKGNSASAKIRLDALLAKQGIGMKESEIAAGLEKENIKGGFDVEKQRIASEGTKDAATITGGFKVAGDKAGKTLDPSQVAENNARAALLTKQAAGVLSKEDQITLNAANKQAEIAQNQKKIGADAYTKTFSETGDPMKAADAQMAVEAALSGDTFVPGTQAQKGTFRFGFGKPETKATAGRVVKKVGANPDKAALAAGYTPEQIAEYKKAKGL